MRDNSELLAAATIFRNLGKGVLGELANVCVRKQLTRGEMLFAEGDEGGALYVIVSGRIRIERIGAEGATHVLGVRAAGEAIGEMSLIDALPRSAQAVAATNCKLLVLYRAAFEQFVLTQPSASLAIMQAMSKRIREAAQMLVDFRSKEVPDRLLDYLRSECDADRWVQLQSSQAALAEVLGCTREAVNRAFGDLEGRGVIVRSGPRLLQVT